MWLLSQTGERSAWVWSSCQSKNRSAHLGAGVGSSALPVGFLFMPAQPPDLFIFQENVEVWICM